MASGVSKRCGSFVGTGSALKVETLGFKPGHVKLMNVTGNCDAEWAASMADAAMRKTVDSGGGTTDVSYVTSNGVTPLDNGFQLGADSDLNVSGETVHWVADDAAAI